MGEAEKHLASVDKRMGKLLPAHEPFRRNFPVTTIPTKR